MPAPRTTAPPRDGMGHNRTRDCRDEQALLEAELSYGWAHSNATLLKMARSVSSKKIVPNAVDVKRSTTDTPKDWLLMLFLFSLVFIRTGLWGFFWFWGLETRLYWEYDGMNLFFSLWLDDHCRAASPFEAWISMGSTMGCWSNEENDTTRLFLSLANYLAPLDLGSDESK